MKLSNSIGWCDDTTNAVTGCDKVSPGCKNCYAATGTRARVLRARGIETWGPNGVRHPVAEFAEKIQRLNKLCVCDRCHSAGYLGRMRNGTEIHPGNQCTVSGCQGQLRRPRLFADSNSDWLDEKWPIETFKGFLEAIILHQNIDVLLLTKRPENFRTRLQQIIDGHFRDAEKILARWWLDGHAPPHVWLGVSVENQAIADKRIPLLLQIPAAVRFLSCEPLLEKVDIENFVLPSLEDVQAIYAGREPNYDESRRWVIVGGESGKDRRDCGVDAISNIAEQCQHAEIACYVKQDCAFKSGEQGRIPNEIWNLKQFPSVNSVAKTSGC